MMSRVVVPVSVRRSRAVRGRSAGPVLVCCALGLAACGDGGDAHGLAPEKAKPSVLALAEGANDRLLSVVMAEDGRAYAAGYVADGKDQAMAVVRLTADGKLDPSFGDGGVAKLNVSQGLDKEAARGVALQDDGKVVIAGPCEHDASQSGTAALDTDVALVRFDADGKLDESFGDAGVLRLDLGTGVDGRDSSGNATLVAGDTSWGLQQLADGRLFVVAATRGVADDATDLDLALVAVSADGALDDAFGEAGVLRVDVDGGSESPRQSVQLDDGHIVTCGYTQKDALTTPLLVKLDPSGQLDSTFGSDGLAHPELLASAAEAYDIERQGTAFITVGYGKDAATDTVDLISPRFSANGKTDATYGKDGLLRVDVAGQDDRGRDLTVLPDGRLLFVGNAKPTADNADAMLVLASKDGVLDSHFGDGGKALYDLGGVADSFYGVALSPDKKRALIVGYRGGDAKAGEDDAAVLVLAL